MSLQEVAAQQPLTAQTKVSPLHRTAFIVSNSFLLSLGEEESHTASFLPLFSRCRGSDAVETVALTWPANHIGAKVGKSSVQGGIPVAFLLQAPRNLVWV